MIKSRYALLDLKCNKLEIRLKQFLRKIVKIVLDEINKENKTAFQMKDVYFEFEREVITNAQDNASIEKIDAEKKQIEINSILSLEMLLGKELVTQNICEILDIDYDDIKNKLPTEDDEMDQVNEALSMVTIEGE